MQLQTRYKEGGKTDSCAAADRIQAGGKDRKLYSCRQDISSEERQGAIQLQTGYTSMEERQEAMQLQTGYKQGGKTES